MKLLGLDILIQNVPSLDPGFIPISLFNREFLRRARKPVAVCVERDDGLRAVYDTFVTGENREADRFYIERTVKFLLWARGGFRVTICGDEELAAYIARIYGKGGARAFDSAFMEKVYERAFEVLSLPLAQKPEEKERPKPAGGNLTGCRIGFDAGGSDRKVSAVIDGEAVYSEEVVWHPKTAADPAYHYSEILGAFKTAAAKMPRVDSIGVSSAGIYIGNRTMVASLFLKVPPELFEAQVKDIYIRAAEEAAGGAPLRVYNDGDVTALAGAMELGDSNVLGIAMGTSEAGGFVDRGGNITGWLNELAFAPVDASPAAMADEWSGDTGCGVKYFSQDAVIKLAANAGIGLDPALTPGEKLKAAQELLEQGDARAAGIFSSIGCYLGHALPYYWEFYGFKYVLLLGRVMSGAGGNLIAAAAKQVLAEEYPACDFIVHVPEESQRRVGQSVAAASL
ncbi:MAG: ROK family protein [Oscillospiraceae bacterium]|jgi:predicted NBD/HSP70 family sugar kinase|nr:ROK family protein [Oscillospiraceae bacterium]